jgi:hypothetical protein
MVMRCVAGKIRKMKDYGREKGEDIIGHLRRLLQQLPGEADILILIPKVPTGKVLALGNLFAGRAQLMKSTGSWRRRLVI